MISLCPRVLEQSLDLELEESRALIFGDIWCKKVLRNEKYEMLTLITKSSLSGKERTGGRGIKTGIVGIDDGGRIHCVNYFHWAT